MTLESLDVSNYKSIRHLVHKIEEIDDSKTFTLLGINEAGKTTILRSFNLLSTSSVNYPDDFHDKNDDIVVKYSCTMSIDEKKLFRENIRDQFGGDEKVADQLIPDSLVIVVRFASGTGAKLVTNEFNYGSQVLSGYRFDQGAGKFEKISKGAGAEESAEGHLDDKLTFMKQFFDVFVRSIYPKMTLWQSTREYLITEELDLEAFATNPEAVSKPLYNCFRLAGLEKKAISNEVAGLSNPANRQNLCDRLSDHVTAHIKRIWPEHPIKIKFTLNGSMISFLVEDEGVKYSAKTTGQRSDGFRQFISFLLTISIEGSTDALKGTVLLIDEPETHLHPQAQINLLKELIALSGKNNNIVFFATHSNYMIDKENLSRCFQVRKVMNTHTELEQLEPNSTTYAEVNYSVFGVASADYHNELYGFIEGEDPTLLAGLQKSKKWKNKRSGTEYSVSLQEFIRHSIHHPENRLNRRYSPEELEKSIKELVSLRATLT